MATGTGSIDFSLFFRSHRDAERFQVSKDEATWMTVHRAPDEPVDMLLSYGCGVQYTPHIKRECAAVLEALGKSFVSVGGPQYCCGKPYWGTGNTEISARIADTSVERFLQFRPKTMVQWCGACQIQFEDIITKKIGDALPIIHISHYIFQELRTQGDQVRWKQPVDARVLVHSHAKDHDVRRRDRDYIVQILDMIPGAEFVGYLEPLAGGDPCGANGTVRAKLDSEEYRAIQAEVRAQAEAAGATMIVYAQHGCQRDWCKFSFDGVEMHNWMSVLARALGCEMPDRFQEYWHLEDPEEVVQRARPQWESWGWTEEEARELAHKYFVPSYAEELPKCNCAERGGCSATGATFLWPVTDEKAELPVLHAVPK